MSTADVRIESPSDEKQSGQDEQPPEASPERTGTAEPDGEGAGPSGGTGASGEAPEAGEEDGAWDDGLIARRSRGASAPGERSRSRASALWGADPDPAPADAGGGEAWEFPGASTVPEGRSAGPRTAEAPQRTSTREAQADEDPAEWPPHDADDGRSARKETQDEESGQGRRVAALRRLVDLSRSRIPGRVLAEAQRVLDSAGARGRLPRAYTTVAIAGATGSGKSSLFNALAGTRLSQAGMRRPTTSTPVACSWEIPGAGTVDGLLDRLAIPPSTRRLMRPESDWRGRIDSVARNELEGLVLIDMPDHDSAAAGHREQVDRLLRLVDAVVWVVDPEKYADAVLHERYLRPLAGYAEVTFIVLNQTDRLPGEATDAVLNDLRRLLDEDGMALGEHGEPGARVLATSALVGEGIDELRTELSEFVQEHRAAELRLSADLDGVVERLRPVYTTPGSGAVPSAPAGLTEEVRESFADQLASAAGAVTAGQAAERVWLRHAQRACGTPWAQLQHWYDERQRRSSEVREAAAADVGDGADQDAVAGPSAAGGTTGGSGSACPRVARPAVAHAVRTVVDQAAAGLPEAWRRSVRDAAWRGAAGLPEALDEALRNDAGPEGAAADAAASAGDAAAAERGTQRPVEVPLASDTAKGGGGRAAAPPRPVWWTLAFLGQLGLLALQVLGAVWVLATALGASVGEEWMGVALLIGGMAGGSLLAWGCRFAARGPAAAYGQREELR